MLYLALGAAVLALILWASRGRPILKRREWRLLSGLGAVVSFAAAALVGLRGGAWASVALAVLGLWMAVSTRSGGVASTPPPTGRMSPDEARAILGVGPNATPEEIQAAYTRLMRLAHPDKGGTSGLASQLNAARDRLLRR